MDSEAARRDDVVPTDWGRRDSVVSVFEARRSSSIEYLHFYIEPNERAYWIQRLPELHNLKYLEVKSRPNQELFEAICSIPNLERLNMYWSNITDLTPIKNLQKLTHLCIGSSPKLSTFDPLSDLGSLVSLFIAGNHKKITNISPVGELRSLKGLALCGADYTTQYYDTLMPLGQLKNIIYFSLFAVKTGDRRLEFISRFEKLKYLDIQANSYWFAADYMLLHTKFPNVDCEDLKLAATDENYRKRKRIK